MLWGMRVSMYFGSRTIQTFIIRLPHIFPCTVQFWFRSNFLGLRVAFYLDHAVYVYSKTHSSTIPLRVNEVSRYSASFGNCVADYIYVIITSIRWNCITALYIVQVAIVNNRQVFLIFASSCTSKWVLFSFFLKEWTDVFHFDLLPMEHHFFCSFVLFSLK